MQKNITPLPWKLDEYGSVKGRNETVLVNGFALPCGKSDLAKANTAFIVKACNSHDELVAALKDAVDSLEYVNKVVPILVGCGVRAERIKAAQAILAKLEAK